VARLEELRRRPARWQVNEARRHFVVEPKEMRPPEKSAEMIVLVRHLEQLDVLLGEDISTIYCEFEDIKKYRKAVARVRDQEQADGRRRFVWVMPPRIYKSSEAWILKQVRTSNADGYIARNYDHLRYYADHRMRGDFSLNVANQLSAEYFIESCGLERVTASYDLNIQQLEALLRAAPPRWFEITLHQRMPMFHMEHCVFCAFLSEGTDYTNCGRPCDRHRVSVRDPFGNEHPLMADAGCRNTVFNSLAQTGAEYLERMRLAGAGAFRLDFLHESGEELQRTVAYYRQLLAGEIKGADLWKELQLKSQLGVTRGQLGESPKALLYGNR
jgi:putative protease